MYQLVSAIVKPLADSGRWRNLDIGNTPLNQLFSQYRKVIATLSNNYLDHLVSLNLEVLRVDHGASTRTFNQFLSDTAGNTLPTTTDLPVINTRYTRFADGFHAGYKVEPTHPTASPSSEMPEPERTWLKLTKPGIDYNHFYESCLVNINGYYHMTDKSDSAIYVVDGMKSALHAKRNNWGILNFESLGKLSFIPITAEMIYTQKDEQKYRNNCYIDTEVDLSDKTVMLVLGGYLHVLDKKTFYRISPTAFAIDFSNLPLVDRYYESRSVIDLSVLGLEKSLLNDSLVAVDDLHSDSVLMRYLTMSQSFFVVLDNPDIFIEYQYLRPSPYRGVYTAYTKPIYPLEVGAGRHEPFWYTVDQERYSVHANATQQVARNYDTTEGTKQLLAVSDAQLLAVPGRNAGAKFMLIGSDI